MLVAVAGLVVMVASARSSSAQTPGSEHARVSVNVGVQPSTSTFTATTSTPLYEQTSTLTTRYGVSSGSFADGGVTLPVSGGFGVGVSASWFTHSQTAPISGTIPNPLSFTTPRPIAGISPELERRELTGYIDAAYTFSAHGVDLVVSGGPAFFTVNQDLAANVTFTESPSHDSVAFTGVVVTRATETSVGFNASVDVGVRLSKNIGVGALVRYAQATLTLPLANTASGVRTDAGGAHVGGGLRIYF